VQEAIRELEDEGEDQIVLPRSRTPRGVIDDASDSVSDFFFSLIVVDPLVVHFVFCLMA
jgi:hypothetical protein